MLMIYQHDIEHVVYALCLNSEYCIRILYGTHSLYDSNSQYKSKYASLSLSLDHFLHRVSFGIDKLVANRFLLCCVGPL